MKTDLSPSGHYLNQNLKASLDKKGEAKKNLEKNQVTNAQKSGPDYKLDLSLKTPDIPVPSPTPNLSAPKVEDLAKASVKSEIKSETVKAVKPQVKHGSVKKDLVVFIKGLDLFSSPSTSERGYAGVGKMADSIEDSKVFKWNQKQEILDEVLKTHPDNKVVIIGHSLGGDTAVEIADELDSLENQFRTVDLLVTMDAVGMSNDIIPQNVKRHLNVFGESNLLLNDGPHVARRNEKTSVVNILSGKDHTAIDDDKEVQFEIVNLVKRTLVNGTSS